MNNKTDLYLEARDFEEQGEFELAAREYEKKIQQGIGDLAVAHQGRGRALARLGHLEEAIDECKWALTINPDLQLARHVLGIAYLDLGMLDLAEKELMKALSLRPDDTTILANLGYVYSKLNRYDKTIEMYERIAEQQPDAPKHRLLLAQLYLNQSYIRKAINQINQVRAAHPRMFTVYAYYADVLVCAVLQYFGKEGKPRRLAMLLVPFLVALVVPATLAMPLGVIPLSFLLLLVFTSIWFYSQKYHQRKMATLGSFLFFLCYTLVYWVIVYWRYLR